MLHTESSNLLNFDSAVLASQSLLTTALMSEKLISFMLNSDKDRQCIKLAFSVILACRWLKKCSSLLLSKLAFQ